MEISKDHKEQIYKSSELLKALSNPIRLCLLEKLIDEGAKNVNDITSCMEVSQSAISQHLKILRDMDIVESRKEENRIYYSCNRKDVIRIISCLREDI